MWPLLAGGALAVVGVLLAILALAGAFDGSSSSEPVKLYAGAPATGANAGFWRTVDTNGVSIDAVKDPGGMQAVRVRLERGRTRFTAAQWTFSRPQNWYGHRWLFVTFRGHASGKDYSFFVDFKPRHANSEGFTIVDTSDSWRVVALDLGAPDFGKGPFDLRHVTSVRVATNSKAQAGAFEVGQLTLSQSGR
jgi:hypothetical protein